MTIRTTASLGWLCCCYLTPIHPCFSQRVEAETPQAIESVSGVEVPQVGWVPFRLPALTNPQEAAETQQTGRLSILRGLSGRYGWEKLSSNSVAAPVILDIEALNAPNGKRAGYLAYSAFIAYARLDLLRDRHLMEATFGPEAKSEADNRVVLKRLLPNNQVAPQNSDTDEGPEQLAGKLLMRLPLFNRVVINGIVQLHQVDAENFIQLQWQLDPSFTDADDSPSQSAESISREVDTKLQNTWVKLVPNNVGRLVPTDPTPYRGLGGYTLLTATGLAKDQLLIETCMVIHEPYEWFSGSKFLRARLTVSMQESAKNLRRKLSKLED